MPDIPKVTFTGLYGFIDILNHMGSKADVATISSKEQLELVDILPILETGQMLYPRKAYLETWYSAELI